MGIRDLRVKVNLSYAGADTHEETPVDCEQSDGTENSEHLEDIDRVLSSVPQEELKHRLKRLFLKSLEKENSG
jgi:hypothetical protein